MSSNGESSYLNQVDASAHEARERLELARRIEDSARQARLVSQAVGDTGRPYFMGRARGEGGQALE